MVGGPQIRNIGTIGGNTCNGVTSADSASTLHAWDAIVEITGPDGVRRIPIHDFYIKAGVVDLKPAEIQTAIIIPKEHTKATTDITLNTQCVMQWISQQQDVLSM